MSDILVELKGIEKRFSGVKALDDVSLVIKKGEIRCLAGENGCGKSTIIKVISGVYAPEKGELVIDGEIFPKITPIEAIRHGIQVIYQDFSLFGNLTVAENLTLNTFLREDKKLMNWKRAYELGHEVLSKLNVDIDLDAEVSTLPTAGRQIVAIARAILSDARLIIMDEPTTTLTRKEVETLFRIVKEIQSRGIAVLFVSHKMREMLEISEQLTIMRNGRKVAEGPVKEFDEASITHHMTGQNIKAEHYIWNGKQEAVTPRMEIENLTVPEYVSNVNLKIWPGEIVGLSGLLGSGRTALALTLFGLVPEAQGKIHLDGKEMILGDIQKSIEQGIAYVPEDRLTEGLFHTQSIDRNILATSYETLAPRGVIKKNNAQEWASNTIKNMQIATPDGDKFVGQLSGGNQQRVVLGRWFLTGAKVLILNGPTVGVDVGSKAEIHKKIRELAVEKGLAVLMISDDVPELIQNCNRIILMHRGQFVDEFSATSITEDEINDKLKSLQ